MIEAEKRILRAAIALDSLASSAVPKTGSELAAEIIQLVFEQLDGKIEATDPLWDLASLLTHLHPKLCLAIEEYDERTGNAEEVSSGD